MKTAITRKLTKAEAKAESKLIMERAKAEAALIEENGVGEDTETI
ncbi:MAG: hypothetical protein RSD40_00245 [Bacilli bacterium]